jgi:hypothetical protein
MHAWPLHWEEELHCGCAGDEQPCRGGDGVDSVTSNIISSSLMTSPSTEPTAEAAGRVSSGARNIATIIAMVTCDCVLAYCQTTPLFPKSNAERGSDV